MTTSTIETTWAPYDFHPQAKIASLRTLFDTAKSRSSDPRLLCKLAADIQRLTMRPQPAVELFESIVAASPESVEALSGFAQGLRIDGQTQRAITVAERGLKIQPTQIDLLVVLTKLYIEDDRPDDADRILQRLIKVKPEAAEYLLCKIYVKSGRLEEAAEACEANVLRNGWDTNNSAMTCALSHLRGDEKQLHELLDFDLLQYSDQHRIVGRGEVHDSNQTLIQKLTDNQALEFEPHSTATRQGSQAMLNELDLGESAKFVVELIQNQVERYIAQLPEDHPFARRRPEELKLSIWCVVLNEQGHQRPHTHPAGWLSGVYYLQVPEFTDESGDAGAIELGCLPDEYMGGREPVSRVIRPEPGRMLLFPSYFYHRTIPHHGDPPRICIAFDVG